MQEVDQHSGLPQPRGRAPEAAQHRVGFGTTTASGNIPTTGGLPGALADSASSTWHVPFLEGRWPGEWRWTV
jgi:hypothetical protein